MPMKRPEDRYQTAGEMAQDLRGALTELPRLSTPVPRLPSLTPDQGAGDGLLTAVGRWIVPAALLAIVLLALMFTYRRHGTHDASGRRRALHRVRGHPAFRQPWGDAGRRLFRGGHHRRDHQPTRPGGEPQGDLAHLGARAQEQCAHAPADRRYPRRAAYRGGLGPAPGQPGTGDRRIDRGGERRASLVRHLRGQPRGQLPCPGGDRAQSERRAPLQHPRHAADGSGRHAHQERRVRRAAARAAPPGASLTRDARQRHRGVPSGDSNRLGLCARLRRSLVRLRPARDLRFPRAA